MAPSNKSAIVETIKGLSVAQKKKLREDTERLEIGRLRKSHAAPGGLMRFVRDVGWPACEPTTPFIEDWHLHVIADHLEAVAAGKITRLLINVCPGSMKSLLTSVFFPCWLWSAFEWPSARILNISFASGLPERDNRRCLQVINSEKFQKLYGAGLVLAKAGEELIETSATGFKQAAGVQSVTGRRADILIYDDPNNIADIESEAIRQNVARTFKEAASNRLNDLTTSAIVVIQQRSHEGDVSGLILDEEMDYVHLCIPALHEPDRVCETYVDGELFYRDPREDDGECFFPEKFPPKAIEAEVAKGPFYWNGQFMQRAEQRGGNILKREFWQLWEDPKTPKCGGQDGWIIASLDPAYTTNKKRDASGLTVWGCFTTKEGNRGAILLYCARLWKDLSGLDLPNEPGETYSQWRARTQASWGLTESVHDVCLRFNVRALYVEAKGPGLSVLSEMEKILRRSRYKYAIHKYDPGNLGKEARAQRVQPLFAAGQIYVPARDGQPLAWAMPVLDECAKAPKGKQDDLLDSTTAALYILRCDGFLDHREEIFMSKEETMMHRSKPMILYNI
jgi:hypothetical protein